MYAVVPKVSRGCWGGSLMCELGVVDEVVADNIGIVVGGNGSSGRGRAGCCLDSTMWRRSR